MLSFQKEENYEKKKDLWKYLKSSHPETYRKLKRNPMGFFINIPGRTGRLLTTGIYRIAKKVFNLTKYILKNAHPLPVPVSDVHYFYWIF